MKLFDSKTAIQKLDEQIQNIISTQKEDFGKLLIIQVGENDSSNKYVNLKKRVGDKLGLEIEILKINENLTQEEISDRVAMTVNSKDVSSVIIQLPLPDKNLNKILDLIPLEKDVDVLSSTAQLKFYDDTLQRTSPVVKSTEYFIYSTEIVKNTKKAIIVGGGFLVGKPVAKMLQNLGIEVEIIENYAPGKLLNADLIVLSAGIPNLVKGEDISEGASVIDFGSSILNGTTVGDLDMSSKLEHLNFLSTSPGGMGPLVVRFLFLNHLRN